MRIARIGLTVLALATLAAWTHGLPSFGFLIDQSSVVLTTDAGDPLVGT